MVIFNVLKFYSKVGYLIRNRITSLRTTKELIFQSILQEVPEVEL